MANSLQDQLLKAGLVTEDDVRQARQGSRKARKRSGGRKPENEAKHAAAQRQRERREQDRARSQALEAQRQDQERRQQIRALVLEHSLNDDKADVPYNVPKGAKLRRIYVTAEQRDGIAAGRLAVTSAKGRHHVVPAEVAERITALMPDYFVFRSPPAADEIEDPRYAEFKIPDDLMW